jgi:hypothetical protein
MLMEKEMCSSLYAPLKSSTVNEKAVSSNFEELAATHNEDCNDSEIGGILESRQSNDIKHFQIGMNSAEQVNSSLDVNLPRMTTAFGNVAPHIFITGGTFTNCSFH